MDRTTRWIVGILVAVAIVALVAFAGEARNVATLTRPRRR